ncbi:hypothetical protein BT96DRAFT_824286 [Gymnopus androsaceus JB14]|uniref:HAT C-terminal dimerisation domain-containing protein n=1 Tax=Gymnopus androsaceus JB14 TaxID=1447944 RepID=A0A6A4HIG2_9AGAR|nr:hypothetical protein BT96DRAFT_824286 [Gymnopus androsaceus JB14]
MQVHGLSFAIIHSMTKVLPAWHSACKAHNMKPCLIPRNVATQWNSTYDILLFAKEYAKVIDDITGNKSLNLRNYELLDPQWKIVNNLKAALKILKDASTISHVIPMMDAIDDFLSSSLRRQLHNAVKAALKLGQATLNQYYSCTDESNVYCIAMVLHPQFKLNYF